MSNRPGREERKDGNNVRNNPPEPRGNRDMGALEREFENQAPRRAPPPQPRQQQQQQQQAPPNYVRMNADFAGVFPH